MSLKTGVMAGENSENLKIFHIITVFTVFLANKCMSVTLLWPIDKQHLRFGQTMAPLMLILSCCVCLCVLPPQISPFRSSHCLSSHSQFLPCTRSSPGGWHVHRPHKHCPETHKHSVTGKKTKHDS